MKKYWKKYKEVKKLVDNLKKYELQEAVELCKKMSFTKFKWTVEVHIKTNADPKYNDQLVRGTIVLPNWTWKSKRVAAYVWDDKIDEAKKLWVEVAGNTELIKQIEAWNIDFDVLITTQDMMRDLAKVAKILWPKWLMPSPKSWTVAVNLKDTVDEIKKWRVEFKLDKTWNIHAIVWNVSFDNQKLIENIQVLLKAIEDNKPSWVKWKLFKKVVINPTMGPSIQLNY